MALDRLSRSLHSDVCDSDGCCDAVLHSTISGRGSRRERAALNKSSSSVISLPAYVFLGCVAQMVQDDQWPPMAFANGHTSSNTPDPIRTRKLSGERPGQYWGGGPPGKPLVVLLAFLNLRCSVCCFSQTSSPVSFWDHKFGLSFWEIKWSHFIFCWLEVLSMRYATFWEMDTAGEPPSWL